VCHASKPEISYYGGIDPRTGVADGALPATFDRKIISADCSFKNSSTSDYVAIGDVGVVGRKRYILNVVNKHLDAAGTEAEIRRQRDLHSYVRAILIEDAANGAAVVERLKHNVPGVVAQATGRQTRTPARRGARVAGARLVFKSQCGLDRTVG